MDLNIKNYRMDELFTIFNLNLDNLNVNSLKNEYIKKCRKIQNSTESYNINKNELIIFFTEAFTCLFDFIKKQDDKRLEKILDIIETDVPSNNLLEKGLIKNEKINKSNDKFINVDNGLLLPLHQTPVIQSNMNNEQTDGQQVQNNIKKLPVTTFVQEYKRSNLNPLEKTSNKFILNINSMFRNVQQKIYPNFLKNITSNFYYKMPVDLKRIVQMKLLNIELPCVIYNVSEKLGSNNFKVSKYPNGYDEKIIKIPSGMYSLEKLLTAIQNEFDSQQTNLKIELIENTNQIMISDMNNENFNLEFNFINELIDNNYCINGVNQNPNYLFPFQLTLGWNLGFRNKLYGENEFIQGNSNNAYISESSPNFCEQEYFFLGIKDFTNNSPQTFFSSFMEETNIAGDILAKIIYKNGKVEKIISQEREYFGPVRIKDLQIVLYDKFGRILDLNNADFSFSLEFTNLYNL